ncbi:ABC-F family ATP-binding cassette domain-containing protein [Mangrovibrevibacter kandeliae]|uniref:ABC-F family ATP-binding cassette domain-containing protein n=1 Tax=Mangrovibrevibacter kandeliae TaxID=2968473 RepID=UPI002119AA1B|nr:ATP-binding cassette domain-containing protein [Aurantimonas sp. CSK15Z-1]MCQ8780945.1 ATP-binding cassette domain-containing protein [Aurantimonas sp. CSK15Z-1]
MALPPLLRLDGVKLTFGGTPLLTGVELGVLPGDRIALVGRNGSGKSTLLKIAAGLVEPDGGEVFRQPQATIRYLPQEPDFGDHETVGAYVAAGLGPADDAYRVQLCIDALGLTEDARTADLSGGEARRAALARVLAPEPDIILLDEPTNHLDLPTIEWLEEELRGLKSAIVVISHDRRFLEQVTGATVWLDRGTARRLNEGFGGFEAWRDKLLEEEERDFQKLGRKIAREEHWLRYGVSARRTRNQRRLGELHALRAERRNTRRAVGTVEMAAGETRESGKLVIEAERIAKRYGDRVLVEDFSTRILRGDRIGLVGPNGAGKTTLLKMLIGELAPDAGRVRLGTNLDLAFLDQKRAALNDALSVSDALTDGRGDQVTVNGEARHVAGYLKDFLFQPEQIRTPVGNLSGGERARLLLAKVLASPANLLVLDEPTNDLDIETLDLLQELVANYPGTVLLVSHDRDFLDRTVTSTVTPGEAGRWIEYAGGYSDMLAQRRAEAKAAPRPVKLSPAAETGAKVTTAAPASSGSGKLSYKQKFALETLPKRIAELEGAVAALEGELADPQLFSRKPDRFAKASAELDAQRSALAAAEDEWLELEMLKAEIEG